MWSWLASSAAVWLRSGVCELSCELFTSALSVAELQAAAVQGGERRLQLRRHRIEAALSRRTAEEQLSLAQLFAPFTGEQAGHASE